MKRPIVATGDIHNAAERSCRTRETQTAKVSVSADCPDSSLSSRLAWPQILAASLRPF